MQNRTMADCERRTCGRRPGEAWGNINTALKQGHRGLPGGSSLPRLLARERGVRNCPPPRLTVSQILAWADAHHKRTGRWPTSVSGPVEDVPGETWGKINVTLRYGHRGLPGGSSLARLLEKRRGVVPFVRIRWTIPEILAWADAYHKRTGKWPLTTSGPVVGAIRGTWCAIDRALRRGSRGLPGGSSLAALLIEHRGYEGKLRTRANGAVRVPAEAMRSRRERTTWLEKNDRRPANRRPSSPTCGRRWKRTGSRRRSAREKMKSPPVV